jgi:phosphoribosylformimino-5-aminoimidazole carboxamide ribotide isomerase
MRIIIALDIIDGKCVRLSRGDFDTRKTYSEDPLEVAKQIEAAGLKYLHLVDLDGARNRHITNLKILEEISSKTDLLIDFGGGINTEQYLISAFNAGAKQVTVGTIALKQPSLFTEWLGKYGNEKIILGADFRKRNIVSAAWMESSEKDIVSFISAYSSQGVKYAVCTDAEKDGMMAGPATDIYREILEASGINLIASGGISSLKDIDELRAAGCEGAIVGKAVYEGKIKLTKLSTIC